MSVLLLMVVFVAGVSLLRERQGGFAVAPLTPSHCAPMLLGLYRCRGHRSSWDYPLLDFFRGLLNPVACADSFFIEIGANWAKSAHFLAKIAFAIS